MGMTASHRRNAYEEALRGAHPVCARFVPFAGVARKDGEGERPVDTLDSVAEGSVVASVRERDDVDVAADDPARPVRFRLDDNQGDGSHATWALLSTSRSRPDREA
jgi:hypothetical protein